MERDFIIKVNDEVTNLHIFREVKKSGNGGAVALPKSLIGKRVEIIYKKGDRQVINCREVVKPRKNKG